MNEVGLFCGTFNPIHLGHLLIAECARDQFKLAKVLFVLSPRPPHRGKDLLEAEDRFALVEAACKSNKNFLASRLEMDRPGPSYTVDTVKALQESYERVNLIIGGDNLAYLKTWHNYEELLSLTRLLVVPRLRYQDEDPALKCVREESISPQAVDLPGADIEMVDFPGIAVSASLIRSRAACGKTILYMVPPEVDELIRARGYYKEALPLNQEAGKS